LELKKIGCFGLVLECVPPDLAQEISTSLSIPVIGIGAGSGCDGQILVIHDILGWGKTRFSKTFADVRGLLSSAVGDYIREVKSETFPAKEHEYQ
jgi:3-methyl-2-oxobutanoate hydroxymethyltransferase